MIGWTNNFSNGGAGIRANYPVLHIMATIGATINIEKNEILVASIPPSKSFLNADGMTADYYYSITYGIFTITATLEHYEESSTIEIDQLKQYDIDLADNVMKLDAACAEEGWVRTSYAIGDTFSSNGRYFQRTTNEPVLVCIANDNNSYYGYGVVSLTSPVAGTWNTYGGLAVAAPTIIEGITFYNSFMGGQWEARDVNVGLTNINGVGLINSVLPKNRDYPHIHSSQGLIADNEDNLQKMYDFMIRLTRLYKPEV